MKVGDLVIRRNTVKSPLVKKVVEREGYGIILSKQMAGSNPVHVCVTVYYPEMGRTWDIAESLMEVLSENR